jgi:CheY-like chemotaxis protein
MAIVSVTSDSLPLFGSECRKQDRHLGSISFDVTHVGAWRHSREDVLQSRPGRRGSSDSHPEVQTTWMLQNRGSSLKEVLRPNRSNRLGHIRVHRHNGKRKMTEGFHRPERVLLVEDDAAIRELVRDQLALAGFVTDQRADGREALERARVATYQLIILDLMLPGLDGITLCRTIRTHGLNRDTPILMLTARDTESDKVLGLESGADDYVTKPFVVRELMARIAAILRRSQAPTEYDPGDPDRTMSASLSHIYHVDVRPLQHRRRLVK